MKEDSTLCFNAKTFKYFELDVSKMWPRGLSSASESMMATKHVDLKDVEVYKWDWNNPVSKLP